MVVLGEVVGEVVGDVVGEVVGELVGEVVGWVVGRLGDELGGRFDDRCSVLIVAAVSADGEILWDSLSSQDWSCCLK